MQAGILLGKVSLGGKHGGGLFADGAGRTPGRCGKGGADHLLDQAVGQVFRRRAGIPGRRGPQALLVQRAEQRGQAQRAVARPGVTVPRVQCRQDLPESGVLTAGPFDRIVEDRNSTDISG